MPTLIGAVVGVIGIVGALTFRAGLDHAVSDLRVFGQQYPSGGERAADRTTGSDDGEGRGW